MVLISPLGFEKHYSSRENNPLSVGLRIQLLVMLNHVEAASESICIARISAPGTQHKNTLIPPSDRVFANKPPDISVGMSSPLLN